MTRSVWVSRRSGAMDTPARRHIAFAADTEKSNRSILNDNLISDIIVLLSTHRRRVKNHARGGKHLPSVFIIDHRFDGYGFSLERD